MKDVRDCAVNFEAVKLRMNQTKDGVVLHLAIHPDEVPDALFRSFVGKRYMVAMVELDEQDNPVQPNERTEGQKAVQQAALLCKNTDFQRFMVDQGHAFAVTEEDCTEGLRDYLGVDTRSELNANPEARKRLSVLIQKFKQETGR